MIPMPQTATNVFSQRMGVPPQPQPTFGSNPPMHLPMPGGGMWGGQPPMAGPIGPSQPIQGPIGFNPQPQPQPVGPAPYQPINFGQQPGIMQDPNVQNFLRRRLMGMPGMGAQF